LQFYATIKYSLQINAVLVYPKMFLWTVLIGLNLGYNAVKYGAICMILLLLSEMIST